MYIDDAEIKQDDIITCEMKKGSILFLHQLVPHRSLENYSDEEKLPLSLFWLGEISLISMKYEKSKNYFLSLVSQFPDHWRSPLAHKKIGDVYLSQDLYDEAKEKYQYVANAYPENAAASLALQILENME